MCGIAGIYYKNGNKVGEDLLVRMYSCLKHRGPDDQGHYINGPVGLGHTRLSIIDINKGHQPLSNESGDIWIVFNGEIYNFVSLKKDLISKGHIFRTDTDTEAIVHLYEEKGTDCLNDLRGMFAFAIWDNKKKVLFIARDRLGIKPIYYMLDKEKIIFASELKSILEAEVSKDLDFTAIDDYFSFLNIPAPKTIFKDIRKLEPATFIVCGEKTFKKEQYWNLSFSQINCCSVDEWIEKLLSKWDDTVKSHLISDVPLGAFLSGGIDSSSVVAEMSNLLPQPVNTFSIGFGEKAFDELKDAEVAATYFKTMHHTFTVKPDALKVLKKILWHFDEPFADPSNICIYYLSQMARNYVKVALSGDGGDENFGGYERYYIDLIESKARNMIPIGVRKTLFTMLGAIYPKFDYLPRIFRLKTLFNHMSLSHAESCYDSICFLRDSDKNKMYNAAFKKELKGYSPYEQIAKYYKEADTDDPLFKMLYLDVKTYLPNDYLVKVDRASMANSLEVRPPFLDHEFMELTAQIPSSLKIRGKSQKYIWKEAMRKKLPKKILAKKKKGFDVPVGLWLKDQLKDSFTEKVLSGKSITSNILNLSEVEKMYKDHLCGYRNRSLELWTIYIFELWYRLFINKESLSEFDK
jgi:asparagine synthase (glutamine-hydrolysing)